MKCYCGCSDIESQLFAQLRRAIGDFGVPIAISTMVLLDYSIKDTYTQVRGEEIKNIKTFKN